MDIAEGGHAGRILLLSDEGHLSNQCCVVELGFVEYSDTKVYPEEAKLRIEKSTNAMVAPATATGVTHLNG